MPRNAVRRAVGWQIYGGLLGTLVIFAAVAELLWWVLFLYDKSSVNRVFTIGTHALAAVSLLGLWHYKRTRRARERAMDEAGELADLEGRGFEFRIGPFLVKIEIAFLAMVTVLGFFTGGLLRAAFFIVSATIAVLLHELAHAFAARHYGQIASIRLHMMGGTTFHMGMPLKRKASAIITLAGPSIGLVAGGIAFAIQQLGDLRSASLRDFIFVNAGWALLNLLPILPLDGGKVVFAGPRLEHRGYMLSAIVATVVLVISLVIFQFGLAITFGILASYNFGETSLGRRLLQARPSKWQF